MPYATNSDVALEFKALVANGGFTTLTNVTAAQVDEWCLRASNFIDAKIAGKYTVPVVIGTSPNSFSLLKDVCVWLVKPRVAAILGLQTGESKSSTGNKDSTDWNKRALDTLKEIQSGAMKLSDAPLATSADGTESFTNDNSATLQPPQFTRQGDDW